MIIENGYEMFLDELRNLRFCRVSLFVAKRADLVNFVAKDGRCADVSDPWFGDAWAQYTEAEQQQSLAEYCYYYGKADGNTVYFCKKSRTDRTICFLPTRIPVEHRYRLPRAGTYIFGHVNTGEVGLRFDWWDRIEEAEVRLVGLLLGTTTFSESKIERKLTIEGRDFTDRTPFLLAKALHFRDVDYFTDLMRRGEPLGVSDQGQDVYQWLYKKVANLVPEFWEEFKSRDIGVRKESASPSTVGRGNLVTVR